MTTRTLCLLIATLLIGACAKETAAPSVAVPSVVGMPWTEQGADWAEKKAGLQALGEQFETSQALYDKLKADANGGTALTWSQLGQPAYDWSGVYTRSKGGLQFDPDLPPSGPSCSAYAPRRLHLEVPAEEQDLVLSISELSHNPPLPPGSYTQAPPGGVVVRSSPCQ